MGNETGMAASRAKLRLLLGVAAAAAALHLLLIPACDRSQPGDSARPVFDEDFIVSGEKLYSQNKEELIIRHFFKDRRDGFFVDVGCWHWKMASTTYYLEEHLGWSGIAVDALPMLRRGYEKNRPRTRFFNYIVTDHADTVESFYASGPLSSTSEERVEKTSKALSGKQKVPKEIQVPTITLDRLLDENGVEKIDFLSMDIEGGEPAALAAFDLGRFRPELICIETAPHQGPYALEMKRYFEERGYERVEAYLKHDPVNTYFKPKGGPGRD
jgi:FkbM family methyltransferase